MIQFHRAFRRARGFVLALGVVFLACGGTSGNGAFGPGGGSALCGPNGTNACGPMQFCSLTLGCVGCLGNSDCPAAMPYCAQGACVECSGGAGCTMAGATICSPTTHRCQAPCMPGSCPRNQVCDTATSACVGCVTAQDCGGPDKICDPTTQQCVACATNADCPLDAPRCLASRGACVSCLSNADCGTAAPICDPGSHRCRTGCDSDGQCMAPTPHCDAAAATCVQCNINPDCAGTMAPVCSPAHVCVACMANSDCPPATPYCRQRGALGLFLPPACAECLMDSQCPAAHPSCNGGTCM
jgi:hypothetical protein